MRRAIYYVMAALMCLTIWGLALPVAANTGTVRIEIETILRHNTRNPRTQTFTYRIRWQSGASGYEDIEVRLERDGVLWTGRSYTELPAANAPFTITPLRTGGYNTSPSSRRVTGSATITFTHIPARIQNEIDEWYDDWYWWGDDGFWDWDNRDAWEWCERDNRCGLPICWYCGDVWSAYRNPPPIRSAPTPNAVARPESNPVPFAAIGAMETAAQSASGQRAVITERGRTSITPLRLRSLHSAAQRHGRVAVLHADTLSADRRIVQGRLVVEPGQLTGRNTDLLLGVYTDTAITRSVAQVFGNAFTNRVAVVRLAHTGELGAQMRVAARIDLAPFNTDTLRLYSYEAATGRTVPLPDAQPRIDSMGYLVFHTSVGGHIIVTDRPLTRG